MIIGQPKNIPEIARKKNSLITGIFLFLEFLMDGKMIFRARNSDGPIYNFS